jgi:hypothetical protein
VRDLCVTGCVFVCNWLCILCAYVCVTCVCMCVRDLCVTCV